MSESMTDVMLDQFVVISDHHAHTFAFGSREERYNSHFVNSRLLAAHDVLREIDDYARKHKVKNLVFCGDLFHVREAVPTVAVNLMYDALSRMSKWAKLWLMPGNHDYADREGHVHSLHVFKELGNVEVVDWSSHKLTFMSEAGKLGEPLQFSFVPYTDDRDKAIEQIKKVAELNTADTPHLLFAHLGIQGAKVGSDYVLVNEADLSVDHIPWQKFTACFFGHYHEHQQLFANGWYVGATHQHNWGDANTKRGFLHVRVYRDHVDFDFVETSAPKFIVTRDKDIVVRPQDFVRVITDQSMSQKDVDNVRQSSSSRNCEVVYVPPETTKSEIALTEENLSPTAMVSAWVKSNTNWVNVNLPEVKHEDLVEYGKKILVSVSNG